MISTQQRRSMLLLHYSYLLWYFSYMRMFHDSSCNAFTPIISDTIKTSSMIWTPTVKTNSHERQRRRRRRRSPNYFALYYTNSNDLLQYQPEVKSTNNAILSQTLINTGVTTRTSTTSTTTTTTITTLDDFYTIIQECQSSSTLLVVHWSAPWCRSCQRIAPLLQRTIQQVLHTVVAQSSSSLSTTSSSQQQQQQQQRKPPPIRYVNIPLLYSLSTTVHNPAHHHHHQRTNLHAMFDIRTVPYCHIYHPQNGCIDEFTITTKTIPSLLTKRNNTKNQKQNIRTLAQVQQILESYINSSSSSSSTSTNNDMD